MRTGDHWRFEVPPELAFGSQARPGIPATSRLVFLLRLLRVHKPIPVPAFEMSAPDKVKRTKSGLGIEVLQEGSGATPRLGQNVQVHYAGWLTNGTLFDASYSRGMPATFQVGGVIAGWNEALQTMREGGKVRITVPGDLGYGAMGNPPKIPPNATLVFVIELIKVR
jgi:FKBP-type peptidyl-prolyl cis-trans isomerase